MNLERNRDWAKKGKRSERKGQANGVFFSLLFILFMHVVVLEEVTAADLYLLYS